MPEQLPNQINLNWKDFQESLILRKKIHKLFSQSAIQKYINQCFQSNPTVWNDAFSFNFEKYIPEAVEWAKDAINYATTSSQAAAMMSKQFDLYNKSYESEIAGIVGLKNVTIDQINFLRNQSWARLMSKKYVYLKLYPILNNFNNISKI